MAWVDKFFIVFSISELIRKESKAYFPWNNNKAPVQGSENNEAFASKLYNFCDLLARKKKIYALGDKYFNS
jgi:hypothetical protein